MSAEPPDPTVGSILNGAYRLEGRLGEGGMGAVYRAVQLTVDREVAIKVLRPHGSRDADTRRRLIKRFEREAKATSKLTHPNTVRLFDFGQTEDGTLFLVLELLAGEPLDELLKREGKLAPERVAHISNQICGSLAEAHKLNIVHRDLKPANVLICQYEHEHDFVKVVDFGIARMVEETVDTTQLTGSGHTLGTPAYMSPEQCMAQEITSATDFYALGVMIHEMLHGERPFIAPTPMAMSILHMNQAPPPVVVEGQPEGVARGWRELLRSLLAKQPKDRPASATEVAEHLRPLQRGLTAEQLLEQDATETVIATREPVSLDTHGSHEALTVSDEPAPTKPKVRALVVTAAAAFVAVAGLAGLLLATRSGEPGPSVQKQAAVVADSASEPSADVVAAPEPSADVVAAPEPDPGSASTPDVMMAVTVDAAPVGAADAPPPAADVPPPDVPPAKVNAHLVLESTPSGATVLRGGEKICTTKCDLDLEPGDGPEKLVIERRGYLAKEVEVVLGAGATVTQLVTLKKRPTKKATKPPKPPSEAEPKPKTPKKKFPVVIFGKDN